MLWDQIHVIDLDTVGISAYILVDLISLAVIYDGSFAGGHNGVKAGFWSGGKDTFKDTDPRRHAAYDDADYCGKCQLYQRNAQFPSPFGCL